MDIFEAVKIRNEKNGLYITRKKWDYPYPTARRDPEPAIKIMPTDSPDGCVIYGVNEQIPRRRWYPTAEDLAAQDWLTVP